VRLSDHHQLTCAVSRRRHEVGELPGGISAGINLADLDRLSSMVSRPSPSSALRLG